MSYCIVIPNYNHTKNIKLLLDKLSVFCLPIIMVNDGSSPECSALLRQLPAKYHNLTLIELPKNMGKGGAVQTALKAAYSEGFTHALQVDADGQHELSDADKLLLESKRYPHALISGSPIYDNSIPKFRYYARNITHFWVWIETLSFKIKDTMCGFRVYPLNATIALFEQDRSIGKRMDFDIEVMVKLFWINVNIRFIPTAVIYPDDGVSHFRAWEDNLLISWMHTRLFFGMLIRVPQLISRKFRTNHE